MHNDIDGVSNDCKAIIETNSKQRTDTESCDNICPDENLYNLPLRWRTSSSQPHVDQREVLYIVICHTSQGKDFTSWHIIFKTHFYSNPDQLYTLSCICHAEPETAPTMPRVNINELFPI